MEALCVVMGEQRTDWSATKKMLSRPDLLEKMLSIASKDAIDASTLTALHGYIEMPGFAPEQVANVSKAAHNLCLWIHGVYKHQVVVAGERGTPLVLSPVVALAGKAGMAGGAGAASSKDRSSKDRPVKDRSSHDRPTTATALRSRPTTATARISRPTTASARISTVGLVGKARIAAGAGAASPSLPVTPAKRVAGDRADDDHIATREIGDVGLTKADMKDIKELRSMARPPEKVQLCVCIYIWYSFLGGISFWAFLLLGAGHSSIL